MIIWLHIGGTVWYDLLSRSICCVLSEDVSSKAGGGGAEAMGGAYSKESARFLGAHCGHCSFALCWERTGQTEDHR